MYFTILSFGSDFRCLSRRTWLCHLLKRFLTYILYLCLWWSYIHSSISVKVETLCVIYPPMMANFKVLSILTMFENQIIKIYISFSKNIWLHQVPARLEDPGLVENGKLELNKYILLFYINIKLLKIAESYNFRKFNVFC